MAAPAIDRTVFEELQATAGAEFVAELLETFLDEAPAMLAEMRDAQAAGAADRYRRAAHSLKSNSATFGATTLGQLAREQEQGGLPGSAAAIDALQAEFERSARALREIGRG